MTDSPSRARLMTAVAGYVSERAVRLLLTAAVGIFVARYLGPAGLGLVSYASAVFSLLSSVALLGMPEVLVRDFVTRSQPSAILSSALVSQLPVAAVVSLLGIAVVTVSRDFERDAVLLALVMAPLPLLGLSASVRSYLEATGRIRRIVVTGLTAGVVASSLKLAGVMAGMPVWIFGIFGTIESAVIAAGLICGSRSSAHAHISRRHYRPETAQQLRKDSWPLLLASVAVLVYMKSDLLMLGAISGDRETGIYTSAARLSEVWYFIPVSAAAAVRPRLASLFSDGLFAKYNRISQRMMTALVAISLGATAVVWVSGEWLVRTLYGSPFSEAAAVLQIHIFAAPFVFLGVAASQWFVDRGMTRPVLVRSTAGAAVNVLLNIVLIPRYGARGAAVATLCSYAISSVFLNVLSPQTRPLFRMQARALLLRWPHPPSDTLSRK